MKHCIIEDSSFIIATIDKNDAFHGDAVFVFKKLLNYRDKIKIIIPPLGLYEIIVTLSRKGISHSTIEDRIIKLLHIGEIIITSITEASAFKHCKNLLNISSKQDALRTTDFLITSLAMDYEAQVLTFDQKMWKKTKPVYKKIYYCSSEGSVKDETKSFLNDLSTFLQEEQANKAEEAEIEEDIPL